MKDLMPKITGETREEHIPLMFDEGMSILVNYIDEHKEINRILEIGTAVGWSAMCMANVRDSIRIDTVEIDLDMAEAAVHNIRENGMQDRIRVHHIDALWYDTATVYDLIFVDAAKAQYENYTEHFLKNTHPGTVFVYDNLSFHGIVDDPALSDNRSTIQLTRKIREFRTWLSEDERFETEWMMDKGDGIAFAKVKG